MAALLAVPLAGSRAERLVFLRAGQTVDLSGVELAAQTAEPSVDELAVPLGFVLVGLWAVDWVAVTAVWLAVSRAGL